MSITELSVKRPTAIIMALLLILGLGIYGYLNLGADLFPEANTPIVSISAIYPGAGAEEMNNSVIKPLEDTTAGVSGIDTIHSFSFEGYGYVVLQFKMDVNADMAIFDVQKAVERVKLPEDTEKPVIRKFNLNEEPVLILSVSGDISDDILYSNTEEVKKSLEQISGVGNITIEGIAKKQLFIDVDRSKLDFYGIDIRSIISKLKQENINIPAGQFKQESMDKTVKIVGELKDVNQIKDIRIQNIRGKNVRLGELANVYLDFPEKKRMVRMNEKKSIGILVRKQSDANIVTTVDRVKTELENIKKKLSPGIEINIATDSTYFIKTSLDGTKLNLIEGIITTSIVLLLFLKRFRSSLIVLIAIPTSLIATFFMMYIMKFTMNLLSLLGLAICIGILVDDSIVVLENIHRHLKMGKNPIQAAIDGRTEIGMAAIAITLCDVVVFAPLAFLNDMVGQFFRQFGLTVVCASLFSLLVSFTLTPMLSAMLYKNEKFLDTTQNKSNSKLSIFDNIIVPLYQKLLIWSLNHRLKLLTLIFIMIAAVLSFIPLGIIQTEFLPKFDQGKFNINIRLPAGTNIQKTNDITTFVEEYIKNIPEVQQFFSIIGTSTGDTNTSTIYVNLKDRKQRNKSQSKVAQEVREWGKNIPGIEFEVNEFSIVDRTSIDGTKPLILNITGPNRNILKDLSKKIEDILHSTQGVIDIENSIRSAKTETRVYVDRVKAYEYGFNVFDVATTLRTVIEGANSGKFRFAGEEYDILVKALENQSKNPYDVGTVKIASPTGQFIPLQELVKFEDSEGTQEIKRMNRQNVVTISANLQGRVLGGVTQEVEQKINSIGFPAGYEYEFGGDSKNMSSSFSSLIAVLIVSIVLVYMVLVVLYESYLTPAIRMLSLPCGIIGALICLVISRNPINIATLIGIIMLDGLVSKNGTLLIDYTNTLMKRGKNLYDALIEAGTTRLRPIIMTSMTMIVGMLPIALTIGEGSELKQGIGIVLIGGLISSTILSPILIPIVYTLIDDLKKLLHKNSQNESF